MADPIGENTYRGLAVPLHGETELRQETTNTILSFTHSSANAGRFLLGRDLPSSSPPSDEPGSSLIAGLTVFDIDADGGYRSLLGGSSISMELNSSGLFGGVSGAELLVSTAGAVAGPYGTVTVNTTASTLASSNSGKLHILSTQAATSNFIMLPTSGNVNAGDRWEIIGHTTAVSLWNLSVNGANTGGIINVHSGTTNVINTTGAIDTTATTGIVWWEVVCISSALPEFVVAKKYVDNVSITTASGEVPVIGAGTTA